MTSLNKQPITIIPGLDSKVAQDKKTQELFANLYEKTKTVSGYCGCCKTSYEGNHQNHICDEH